MAVLGRYHLRRVREHQSQEPRVVSEAGVRQRGLLHPTDVGRTHRAQRSAVRDGQTPWCMGCESGSDGWPGTDWIENLSCPRQAQRCTTGGPSTRSRSTTRPSEERSNASVTSCSPMGTWATTRARPTTMKRSSRWSRAIRQDAGSTSSRIGRSGRRPTFPRDGETDDVFPFPTFSDGSRAGVLGGGELVSAFADRPEVRAFVRFLLSPQFGTQWAEMLASFRRISGSSSATTNRSEASGRADPRRTEDGHVPLRRVRPHAAEDWTDLFWDAMMTYLAEGPASLDAILAELEAAWPDDW